MKKPLSVVKKEMLDYAKTTVDLEPGETPMDWVRTYMDALREDGKIVKEGNKYFVIDEEY